MKSPKLIRFIPILALLMPGCGGKPIAIELTPRSADLSQKGTTIQVTAAVRSNKGETMDGAEIAWSTSDTKIATVDGNGLVTAVGTGRAAIKASHESLSAETTVLVQIPKLVKIEPAQVLLRAIGESHELFSAVHDEAGIPIIDAKIEWTSDHPEVAVLADGVVKALAPGATRFTGKNGDAVGSFEVAVILPTAAGITVEPTTMVLRVGNDEQIYPSVTDDLGHRMEGAVIQWTSADPRVATVGPDGIVMGVGRGLTSVTGTTGEVSVQISVRVR